MNLSGYYHIPYQFDDLIRNLEEEEVERVVNEYNRGMARQMKEIQDAKLLSSGEETFDDEGPQIPVDKISRLKKSRLQVSS